jgi:hypothetical protein
MRLISAVPERFPVTSSKFALILTVGWLGMSAGAVGANAKEKHPDKVVHLVAEAQEAEAAGDTDKRYRLLREAVRIAPDYELARWQLGQMQVDGRWVSVEEAQRRAAADPKQSEYVNFRAQAGDSPEGQIALARWCRKNGFSDEARFHWANVLKADPNNEEALRANNMQWYAGELLTNGEIANRKEQSRLQKRMESQWAPVIAKWKRAVTGVDSLAREKALSEIRAFDDTSALFLVERVTLPASLESTTIEEAGQAFSGPFVEALTQIDDQQSTESLVRHAVLSPVPDVRTASITELKNRKLHDYVPLLLGGLAMPIESSFMIDTDRNGNVYYLHKLYREGADSDWALDANFETRQHILPGRNFLYRKRFNFTEVRGEAPPERNPKVAARVNSSTVAYRNSAYTVETQVNATNRTTSRLNSQIMPVLAATTGEDFATAKQWWAWWTDNNEYYKSEHPLYQEYYTDNDNYYYGQPIDTYSETMSCFTKGTPVWTKTGQRPIESIIEGDLVLAQNVDTGELCYRPVVKRTLRPPSETLIINVNGEEIRTTLGHPFWVINTGWQMAKELKSGTLLHGLPGSMTVREIKSAEQDEAYNLVVADMNTYFVGESGVLVHDNMPRKPTRAAVPGVAAR